MKSADCAQGPSVSQALRGSRPLFSRTFPTRDRQTTLTQCTYVSWQREAVSRENAQSDLVGGKGSMKFSITGRTRELNAELCKQS